VNILPEEKGAGPANLPNALAQLRHLKAMYQKNPTEIQSPVAMPLRGSRAAKPRMARGANPGRGDAESRILATAAEMFASFGYNGVSTRDIASGAGVNEVTIYRHYPRKRDLYVAVLDAELQQVKLSGDLLAKVAEADDGRKAVARTFELIAATMMQRPELLRLVQYSALEISEDIDPLLRRHLGQLVEVIARYLEPWVSKGELRCTSAKALVLSLIAIILSHRSLHRLFAADGAGPEAMISAYAEFSSAE
jgi:AcrR family transcriptional regulator